MIAYIISGQNQSQYVAGEYRYYTIYQKYKSKEKELNYSAESYENDNYKLEKLKNKIINSIDAIEDYRKRIILFRDSINSRTNNLSDYERYIKNLEVLKLDIENERKNLENHKYDLIELNNFIAEIERSVLSIKLYNSDISYIYSVIHSTDSTSNVFIHSVDIIKLLATSKSLDLANEILRKKKEEQERKRQEYLAQLQIEREIELQKQNYFNYSSQKASSKYNNYDNIWNNYTRTHFYQSLSNPTTYSAPSSYPTTYNPPTNPNAASPTVEVKGYYKSNGTYVAPHVRTAPNSTRADNLRYP